MRQKVGSAMAILYVVLVNEDDSGLVYEKQGTYEGHCFVETDLQKFVSFPMAFDYFISYGLWVIGYGFITRK